MNKKAIFIIFLCFFLLISISTVISDERTENIEIYLVLDKSLSMVEEIDSVKEYVIENIIDRILIIGDYFQLIPFYGHTDNAFNDYVSSREIIEDLKRNIQVLNADGRFTDIGNALNTLRDNIKPGNEATRKYMLLLTDGKQEAPPESPFYSPDGNFNHEFLRNTKEIQRKGWKIVVLGIGTETAAKEIAEALSAGYVLIPKNSNAKEIASRLPNLLGRLDVIDFDSKIVTNRNGQAEITLKVGSTDYDSREDLKIVGIQLVGEDTLSVNILSEPFSFSVEPEDVSKVSIPVLLPPGKEDYSADLIFVFEGKNTFTPGIQKVLVHSRAGISVIYYFLIIAIVLIFIIFFGLRILQRKKMDEDDEKKQNRSV